MERQKLREKSQFKDSRYRDIRLQLSYMQMTLQFLASNTKRYVPRKLQLDAHSAVTREYEHLGLIG